MPKNGAKLGVKGFSMMAAVRASCLSCFDISETMETRRADGRVGVSIV